MEPTRPKNRIGRRLNPARFGVLLLVAWATSSAVAAGETGEASKWRFSGYGTLARSWDDNSALAPIRDISQRPDDSYASGPSWTLDSRLALQAAYRSNEFGALAQLVAREQVDTSILGAVEMAYGEWTPSIATKWRLGRVGYDAFLMSDHRNLGYSYVGVRPSPEFYGWIPAFSVDGIDLSRDWTRGEGRWRLKAQAGQNRLTVPTGNLDYQLRTDYIWSLTLLREAGPWRVKAGWSGFRIGSDPEAFAQLHAGLETVAATTAASNPDISAEAGRLRRDSAFRDARIDYLTIGIAYDDEHWLVQSELGHTDSTHRIAPAGTSGYLTIGRRLAGFTPYAGASFSRPHDAPAEPGSDWSAIGQGALQTQALFVLNSTRIDQHTTTLGLRWDFQAQAALKLQWDRTRIKPAGYALWFRSPETNDRTTTVNLLTVAVDFVF